MPVGSVSTVDQRGMVAVPAVTVTAPWNPPGHVLLVAYVAVHVPVPAVGVGVGVGWASAWAWVGVGVGVVVGVGVGVEP